MPEYLHPGVYIEEIERGPVPIEGVPTSTAAFLGEAERGSTTPQLVTSYKDYVRLYGSVFSQQKFLPYAVNGFFENGGKRAFICRVVGSAAVSASADFGSSFSVRAAGPGNWGNKVAVKIEPSKTKNADQSPVGFRMLLAYWNNVVPDDPFGAPKTRPSYSEVFEDLVANESSPDYYAKRIPFIDLDKGDTNQGPTTSALGILVRNKGADPKVLPDNTTQTLVNGKDDPNAIGPNDFIGATNDTRTEPQGLTALLLDPYRDVALVYAPGITDKDTLLPIVNHCENQRYRFAVIDAPKGQSSTTSLDPRSMIADSEYAAFYYPWIITSDPMTGARKLIPPGGNVLGVYARTDSERGVFKSPANEILRGVLDLEYDLDDGTQDDLNPKGVNAIRSFPGRGIRVWGARTMSSDALWKYVSVRRLFIFIERSIYEGTQWVVFEPNDDRLWARVIDTIRLFLRTQWRLGALFGRTEQEAFFITCDRTTMTQDDILNGRLICEIGIAPVRPAEFVVFRIFQNTAEAQS
ncbi:MAG: phage tail sheath family protein [Acidobacteriaceae bacterium]